MRYVKPKSKFKANPSQPTLVPSASGTTKAARAKLEAQGQRKLFDPRPLEQHEQEEDSDPEPDAAA